MDCYKVFWYPDLSECYERNKYTVAAFGL